MSESAGEDQKQQRQGKDAPRGCGGGCLWTVVAVLVTGYVVGAMTGVIKDTPWNREPEVPDAEAPEPEPERANPLTLANLLCRRLVEDAAQYDFRWTDGLLGKKFEPVDALGGETVDFIGDAIEMENGFGAWQRHRYACTVWPGDGGSARLNLIEPGRWP